MKTTNALVGSKGIIEQRPVTMVSLKARLNGPVFNCDIFGGLAIQLHKVYLPVCQSSDIIFFIFSQYWSAGLEEILFPAFRDYHPRNSKSIGLAYSIRVTAPAIATISLLRLFS